MNQIQTLQLKIAEVQKYVNEIKEIGSMWHSVWAAELKSMQLEVVTLQISAY